MYVCMHAEATECATLLSGDGERTYAKNRKLKKSKNAKAPKRWLLSGNSKIQKLQKHQNGGCSQKCKNSKNSKAAKTTKRWLLSETSKK